MPSPQPFPNPSPAPRKRPRVYGILGGIASGKSAVAALIAGPRGVVVSADRLAHEVLDTPEVQALLVGQLGPEAVDASGKSDRRWIAERVFHDPAQRERLEGWIHPRVRERISAELERARAAGVERIVLDVPLLLENDAEHGYVAECDALVFVEVREAERERRARSSRGWKAGELARREAAQLPLEFKREKADFVIPNDGTREELEEAVRNLLRTETTDGA